MTDQDGKELFSREKAYEVRNLHFRHNTTGYLGLKYWDLAALHQINLGLDPYETDTPTYIIPLTEGTDHADVYTVFRFIYEEGKSAVIHRDTRRVGF